MGFQNKPQRYNEQGQNLVEFALMLPFLFVVLFGVLDLGRVFFASINLTNAAREGARFLTLHPDDVVNEYEGAKNAVIEEAGYSGILPNELVVDCPNADDDDFCDSGNPATVKVTYDFDLILGWIIPGPISVTRTAVMIVP